MAEEGETRITVNPAVYREWQYAMMGEKAPPLENTMTVNKQVAKACGFTPVTKRLCAVKRGTLRIPAKDATFYEEWIEHVREARVFNPDTDPAAALFALFAYGEKHRRDVSVERLYCAGFPTIRCTMTMAGREAVDICKTGDSAESAICAAIIEAERKRNAK